eukprot:6421994-Pyramimonas_sp.AAC.1
MPCRNFCAYSPFMRGPRTDDAPTRSCEIAAAILQIESAPLLASRSDGRKSRRPVGPAIQNAR